MTKKQITNLAASVRARLERISRESGEDFQLVVTQYVIERTLFRLSRSRFAHRFVLKGAQLFALWVGRTHRPTRDLDLLGTGDPSPQALGEIFREVCAMQIDPDGLAFDPNTVTVSEIRGNQEYPGQRVQFVVKLARMRIELQVDIGFGDVVTPAAQEVRFPVLLEFPAPVMHAYPKETVIAEKLQAMVVLGIANSRMKDFYDVWTMAQRFSFDGSCLAAAIRATFERRRTDVPANEPAALSVAFSGSPDKPVQWKAFASRNRLDAQAIELSNVIEDLRGFLLPPLAAAGNQGQFKAAWAAGGPWSS